MAEKRWNHDSAVKGFPCKDCQERYRACWQDCERYKKAKREHTDKKRVRAEAKRLEKVWFSVRAKNYHLEDPDKGEW